VTTPPAPHNLFFKKICPLSRMNTNVYYNNNNNGGGLLILMLLLIIFSMISSSSAYLAYDLVSGITRGSPEVVAYEKTLDENTDLNAKNIGLDGEEIRKEIRDEYRRTCLIDVKDGKCPKGMKPLKDGCCEFEDPKMKSKFEKSVDVTADIIETLVVSYMAEVVVISVANALTKGALATAKKKAAVAAASKTAAKAGAKTAAKAGTKIGSRLASKFAYGSSCGPICLAVMIALEVFSLALDATDPFGFNNFQANQVIRNQRNYIDVQLQKKMGKAYPMTFPMSAAFPEYQVEFEKKMTSEMLADAFKFLDKNVLVELLTASFSKEGEDSKLSENLEKSLEAALDKAMKNTTKRDKIVYDFYASKGKTKHIEKVSFLSNEDRIGVTLSEYGAKEYNKRMRSKHLDFSNPFKPASGPIPEDYTPFVASYTDTYRVINSANPGKETQPNVVEKQFPRKVCLAQPYGSLISYCEYGVRSSKHNQRLNPTEYGVKFNYERGDCDFTKDYCIRVGLDFKDNDCKHGPGQKFFEQIVGKTLVRTYKTDVQQRIQAWKSGDPAKIAVATLTLPIAGLTPWISKLASAIKDTYGRGVGTVPTRCGPDKEKKGALCYPKCRPGYKSRALECEGTCPPGSKNTGLTCIQGIHAYIPSNRCSNPFRKCFYQRKPCRPGFRYRGSTCNAECLPGFKFRSGAAGTAFCDKPRNRYSRAGKPAPLDCPEGKVKDAGLCYKPCKEGYRGNGPTCKRTAESKQVNIYDV
jgi:hypothetical protein